VEGTTGIAVTGPRDKLATARGDLPGPGHALTGFRASSQVLNFFGNGRSPFPVAYSIHDAMPDAATARRTCPS